MLFELHSAPETFHRTTDVVSFNVKRQFALVYTYSNVVLNTTPELHSKKIYKVLSLLNNSGTNVERKICNFFTSTVGCLSHIRRSRKPELEQTRLKE